MKKTLVAMAALAVVGAASAQSSVTLYGAMDAAFSGVNGDTANRIGLISSGIGSSKLGFMGTEDLGGGLKANFKIEGFVNSDNGAGNGTNTNNQASGGGVVQNQNGTAAAALAPAGAQGFTFNRFAYVGLSGGWGEVRLGNDYISTFLIQVSVDPMGTNGVSDGLRMLAQGARATGQATLANARNAIGYTTPVIAGGLTANVQFWFGENASNGAGAGASDSGNGYALSARYGNGPIFVGLGTQTTRGTFAAAAGSVVAVPTAVPPVAAAAGTLATTGDFTSSSLAASYDFGMAKVTYTFSRESVNDNGALGQQLTNVTNHLGLVVPFGATNVKAVYARSTFNTGAAGAADTIGTMIGLGADYALSKRTKLYATVARVSNDGVSVFSTGGLAGGMNATGGATTAYMIGAFHAF